MFQEPKNYTDNDHFFFQADKDLEKICNAPKDKDGVFKVVELQNGKVNPGLHWLLKFWWIV